MKQTTLTTWLTRTRLNLSPFALDENAPYLIVKATWSSTTPVSTRTVQIGEKTFTVRENYFVSPAEEYKKDTYLLTPASPGQAVSLIAGRENDYNATYAPPSIEILAYNPPQHEYGKEILAAVAYLYQSGKTIKEIARSLNANPKITEKLVGVLGKYIHKGETGVKELPRPYDATKHQEAIEDPKSIIITTTYQELGLDHAKGPVTVINTGDISYDLIIESLQTGTPILSITFKEFLRNRAINIPLGNARIVTSDHTSDWEGRIHRRYLLATGPFKSEVYAAEITIPSKKAPTKKELTKPLKAFALALGGEIHAKSSIEEPLPHIMLETPHGNLELLALPHIGRVAVVYDPPNSDPLKSALIKAPTTEHGNILIQEFKIGGIKFRIETWKWVAETVQNALLRVKSIEALKRLS